MKSFIKKSCLLMAALLICGASSVFTTPAFAAETKDISANYKTDQVPLVSLKHWQDSKPRERYAFLVGFVNMMELEKEWQGQKSLSFKQSLISSWVAGLKDVSLKDLNDGINDYIAANPSDMDKLVVEVLWFKFVQPKLPETDRKKK